LFHPIITKQIRLKKITFGLQYFIMKKSIIQFILLFAFSIMFSQESEDVVVQKISTEYNKATTKISLDSIRNIYGGRYVDYKIITQKNEIVQIDTTLNISKYYKHNYTQKDDFELISFSNQGQAYNRLGYSLLDNNLKPKLGITGKQFGIHQLEDTKYYHVPTPTTILAYRSGLDGQFLNSIFTTNFGKHQNISLGYKGLRSNGDYQFQISSHKQLRANYSYYNPEKRYQFRTHIVLQEISNEENGGLTVSSLEGFKTDDPNFITRSRINVNLSNTDNTYRSTRYYFEHEFNIFNSKDSFNIKSTNLKLGHSINRTLNDYYMNSQDVEYFEDNQGFLGLRERDVIADFTQQNITKNEVYLNFDSPLVLGDLKVFATLENYKHFYGNSKLVNGVDIAKQINENFTSIGASWNAKFKRVFINAYGEQLITGGNLGSNLHINAGFNIKNNISAKAGLQLKSVSPNSIFNLYQSNLSSFNWTNNFDNEVYRTLYGEVKTPWLNAELYLHQIANYSYFNTASLPVQYTNTVNYTKLKVSREFKFKKFRLNNSLMYQNTIDGDEVFRVPQFVTRNTLYYQSYFFKGKPLLAQIGVNFKYFSSFYANEFNPFLNEFYLQDTTKIGNYPYLDFFINAEVRRTRIYFSVENVTAQLTGRDYFVTPNQPQKDLTVRFGLVWNFWN